MHEDFDAGALRLRPVQVEVWMGPIFVCLADQPPRPVAEQLGEVDLGGRSGRFLRLVHRAHPQPLPGARRGRGLLVIR
jgi:phenylpropionate dioxygenase-like ring-hydroxylating dioxygenase large terminal subunit